MPLLVDIFMTLSKSIDLVNREIGSHNKRVAYITGQLSQCLGLVPTDITKVVLAASLHDIGVLKENDCKELTDFNYSGGIDYHSMLGYKLLDSCELTKDFAPIIKYHHVLYKKNKDFDEPLLLMSEIIHLADRVDVHINYRDDLLNQKDKIVEDIQKFSGERFNPEIVKCFVKLAQKESFWYDLQFNNIEKNLKNYIYFNPHLSLEKIHDIAKLFTKIIDFRSRYTATHSTSVAVVARELGRLLSFSERECLMLDIAGHLHDIGKLAIPLTILEKSDKLNPYEWRIMKRHTYFTFRILDTIDSPLFRIINEWASYHHEKIDGSGYPFKVPSNDLTMGSRIVAVADMFTALAESRPYRHSMDDDMIKNEFEKLKGNKLDSHVVDVMLQNYDFLKQARANAFCDALAEFDTIFDVGKEI